MTSPNIADLQSAFYGGGRDEEYEFLLSASDAGLTAAGLLAAPLALVPAVGDYLIPQNLASKTSAAVTQGFAKVAPLIVPKRMTFDRIATELVTIGANSVLRLVVYADNGDARPGALVLDAGTVDGTATPAVKTITIDQTLDPGLYWIGGIGQGGTSGALWRTISAGGHVPQTNPWSGAGFVSSGWVNAGSVTGAAAATFGTATATVGPAIVGLRRATDPS